MTRHQCLSTYPAAATMLMWCHASMPAAPLLHGTIHTVLLAAKLIGDAPLALISHVEIHSQYIQDFDVLRGRGGVGAGEKIFLQDNFILSSAHFTESTRDIFFLQVLVCSELSRPITLA